MTEAFLQNWVELERSLGLHWYIFSSSPLSDDGHYERQDDAICTSEFNARLFV